MRKRQPRYFTPDDGAAFIGRQQIERDSEATLRRGAASDPSSPPLMRFGYLRNTHGPDGEFRNDLARDSELVLTGIHADAGFLVHMLDSHKAMSRVEIAAAVDRYDADFPDTAPACLNINENLLALLECGMAVMKPLP